jgi:hypothetical protein
MPRFLVLGIYFLLSGDRERAGWNHFLHGGFVEDAGNNYGVEIPTWGLLFPGGDIKVEMVSLL